LYIPPSKGRFYLMKILIIQQNDRGCIGKQHYMQQPPTLTLMPKLIIWCMNQQHRFRRQSKYWHDYTFRGKAPKSKRIPESSLEIRANKYDLLIDAYSKLESWLVVLLSGAKEAYLIRKRTHFSIYWQCTVWGIAKNLGLAIERRLSLLDPFTYR
jgi:heptosyltransferase-2